jgi:hypothetical protein
LVKGSDKLLAEYGRAHKPPTFGAFYQGAADIAFQDSSSATPDSVRKLAIANSVDIATPH